MVLRKAWPDKASHSSKASGLIEVSRCWSRSSKPSPGQCFTEAATPDACNARTYATACDTTVSISDPYERVPTAAARKRALISTTGVNDQLKPSTRASEASMVAISAVRSGSPQAAIANWFGTGTMKGKDIGPPSRSPETSGGISDSSRAMRVASRP